MKKGPGIQAMEALPDLKPEQRRLRLKFLRKKLLHGHQMRARTLAHNLFNPADVNPEGIQRGPIVRYEKGLKPYDPT